MKHALILVTFITFGVVPAFGQLTYVSQSRSVSSALHDFVTNPSQTLTAPDFSPFNQTSQVSDAEAGFQSTNQNSTLGSSSINVSGSFVGDNPIAAGNGTSTGESITDVTFTVSSPTAFQLSGFVGQAPFNENKRTVDLDGPGVADDMEGPNSFSTFGTLAPGQYTLLIDVVSATAAGSGNDPAAPFNVTLSVPEPASVGTVGLACLSALSRRRRSIA